MKLSHVTHDERLKVAIDASFTDNGEALRSARTVPLFGGLAHVSLHSGGAPTEMNHGHHYNVTCSADLAAFVSWRWLTLSRGTTQAQVDAPDAALVADLATWGNRTAQ